MVLYLYDYYLQRVIKLVQDKFKSRIDKCNKIKEGLNKRINAIATIRLFSFILIVFIAYRYLKVGSSNLHLYLLLIAIMVLVALIIYHNKLKNSLKYAKGLIFINNQYLDRINGNWIEFSDFGEDFRDKTHAYSNDLDIVGKNSLYQRLNLSHNYMGRKLLAEDLLNSNYTLEEILKRQNAIEELGSKLDFIQNLEYASLNTKIQNPEDLISYFEEASKNSYSNIMKTVIKSLPVFVLGVAAVVLSLQIKPLFILVFALFTIQIIFWLIGLKKNDDILVKVGQYKNNLEVYLDLLKVIEIEDFQSPLLKDIKVHLQSGTSAIAAIKKLDMISERINIKHSGMVYLILNILFLWDYRSVFALESWKVEYGKEVRNWINSIGQIQSLTSLSVLLQIEDNLSFPIIEEEKSIIATSCGHPLIQMEERVNNHIYISDNILVITGSNMSGKTTFLRTIGINLVLLNAGTVTVSEYFKAPIINIYTSMRVTDDLKNKISTFYAELLRLKEILDYGKEHPNALFLIDEIFKGTNSKDRILGAKNVLLNLNKLGLMGAITTHDFELCELDKYPRIKNYHFAEDYVEGKISFDYKIKEGRSTSTNARYLMELVGIEFIN